MTNSELRDITKDGKYLVTGASGFIGQAVCTKLLEMGANVCGTSRRNVSFDAEAWSHVRADLTNADDVDHLFAEAQPEFVIHLASCVTGKREIEWIRETLAGNLQTSVNVLVAAQNCDTAKTVLAGSLEEPDIQVAHPVAASPYAASKWCASTYARTMHALYGTNSAVARIFMVYGPGQRDLSKLIPYVCTSAAQGEAPELMSGDRAVDWIYVDDVVDGLIRLAHSGPDDGAYVDLGSGQLVTTGKVAERICAIAGMEVAPHFGAMPDRAMEQIRKADVDATKSVLDDWLPATDLDSGLERTYEWYRQLSAESG